MLVLAETLVYAIAYCILFAGRGFRFAFLLSVLCTKKVHPAVMAGDDLVTTNNDHRHELLPRLRASRVLQHRTCQTR